MPARAPLLLRPAEYQVACLAARELEEPRVKAGWNDSLEIARPTEATPFRAPFSRTLFSFLLPSFLPLLI